MGAIIPPVKLEDGNLVIEAGDSSAIRRAAVAKILTETVVSILGLVLIVNMYQHDEMAELLKKVRGRVRNFLFGPPPPTEAEIREMARQVHIQAKRILREAE